MEFDPTITISVIVALVALISPIIVAKINNSHQLKLKKLELNDTVKRNVLEHFTNSVGCYIHYVNPKNESDVISSLYNLIPYFKIDFYSINQIVSAVKDKNKKRFNEEIEIVLKYLKEQL